MNSIELLCRQADRQLENILKAAKSIPPEKLDWKPSENTRSALDQLQEVATAIDVFWPAYAERKIEWNDEMFGQWMEMRSKLTTLEELENACRNSTKRLTEFVRGLKEEELDLPVIMPFPGEFTLADIISYHYWNMSYHEGQINMIGFMLTQ